MLVTAVSFAVQKTSSLEWGLRQLFIASLSLTGFLMPFTSPLMLFSKLASLISPAIDQSTSTCVHVLLAQCKPGQPGQAPLARHEVCWTPIHVACAMLAGQIQLQPVATSCRWHTLQITWRVLLVLLTMVPTSSAISLQFGSVNMLHWKCYGTAADTHETLKLWAVASASQPHRGLRLGSHPPVRLTVLPTAWESLPTCHAQGGPQPAATSSNEPIRPVSCRQQRMAQLLTVQHCATGTNNITWWECCITGSPLSAQSWQNCWT